MSPKEGNALLMVLGKGGDKAGGPPKGDPPAKPAGDSYDADLKTALADLAAALGVQVKDAKRGIAALRAICDVCERESGAE